ncbi:MAG: ATP-binding protein, partial [Tannerellaceae bacterium]|nr:ATP-binding protein [Tannerellaceae bacterium]
MLIRFSVQNYKTFKDKAILSMVASNYDKDTREVDNVINDRHFNLRILKSSVIYGANASGKTKLIEALGFMKRLVLTSSKESQKGDKIEVEPFRLSTETETTPSEFEIIFISNGTLYRYGFEVNYEQIVSEWLFYKSNKKEVELFYRDYQDIETHPRNFSKGNTLVKEGLIRDNALL